jgi:hypothetical protein
LNRNVKEIKKSIKNKVRFDLVDNISKNDKDNIILQYVKCRKDCFIISLWKPAVIALDEIIKLLEQYGNIYYVKKINLTKKALKNLLFWYYDDFTQESALNFINKKLDYIDTTDENNEMCYIMFDNIKNKQIAGQGAEFKQYLRRKILEFAELDKKKYRGNDIIHINDHFYQTVEYSQIILNQNTLDMLNYQDCENFLNEKFISSNLKIQTLRKLLYNKISLLELDRYIIMGGAVFYTYGIRTMNDIDSIMIGIKDNQSDIMIDFIEKHFVDKQTKFTFIDAGIETSTKWNPKWTEKNKKILDLIKINDQKELVLDPQNFFFFQGIKIIKLSYELMRKLIRNKIKDQVDFLVLKEIYPHLINNLTIPDNITNDNNKNNLLNDMYLLEDIKKLK